MAEAFGVPDAVASYEPFGSRAVFETPGFTGYIAEVDGFPIATAAAMRDDDWVGIFTVATQAAHRRQGYARAVMNRLLIDAQAAGIRHAMLHSTPAGLELYRGLGFDLVENWTYFFAAPRRKGAS
jgi:ribosomal protein S18 acetylase RimI-like enzyme